MNGRQRRWRGAAAASIVLLVAGLLDGSAVLVLAAAIPLGYVAIGSLSRVRFDGDGLVATRRIDPTTAAPGRAVAVELTVENRSERTLPDVRIADGVPADLAVVSGSPRAGGTLRPGETETVRYLLSAKRGTHEFRPPHLRLRGLGAVARTTTLLSTGGDSQLVCELDADAPPIAEYGAGRAGRLETDTPGSGVTFHSTREYHPDDPAHRIDWRHYAKRGDLATTNYERHVAATVVLVLDARERNRVVAGPGRPTAVEIGAYAATHALSDLLGRGHDVAVAAMGVDDTGPEGFAWLPPAGGREQRARGVQALEDAVDDDGETPADPRDLVGVLPGKAQLVFVSPFLDDEAMAAAESWKAAGVPVTVLSPDVVSENTVSGQYTQIRRRRRLARCQKAGVRAVDWRRGTPLPVVLAEAFAADARLPAAASAPRGGEIS